MKHTCGLRVTVITLLFSFSLSGVCQPDQKKIDAYLAKSLRDWEIPGMAVAIVKDGEVWFSKGYGVKEVGKPTPVNEQTLFAMASNTKAFIASALARLVDQGKLSWQDRVRDHIPSFELYDPWATTETTIEDLLCHRVGLGTFSGDLTWYKSRLSVPEIIGKIKYVPQAYGFRNGYGYSNLMYIAAGEVIRSVTGQTWDEYVKKEFFDPLGMSRTITSTDQLPEMGNFASPHKPYENGMEVISWVNWDQVGAAGGIISSVADMASWLIMNLNRGVWKGDTLISRKQQIRLLTPHNNYMMSDESLAKIPGRHFSGYGLGWELMDYFGNLVVSHSGGYDGMYSRVVMVPDQNLGIVILTNSMKGNTFPLSLYIMNQFIQKDTRDWSAEWLQKSRANNEQAEAMEVREEKRKKKLKPIHDLKAYTGTYYSGMHGNVIVSEEDGLLTLRFEDNPGLSATLRHWHYNIWEIDWKQTHAWFDFGTVQFLMNNNLEINGLHFDVPNNDIFFDEMDLKKVE